MSGEAAALKVGVVQAPPAILDLAGGLRKAGWLVAEASRQGVDLLVFPDGWLPGYPWNLWLQRPAWGMPLARRHLDQAVDLEGEPWRGFRAAVRGEGVALSLGLAERVGDALFDSQVVVDRGGRLVARLARPLGEPGPAAPRRRAGADRLHCASAGPGDLPPGAAALLALDDAERFSRARRGLLAHRGAGDSRIPDAAHRNIRFLPPALDD